MEEAMARKICQQFQLGFVRFREAMPQKSSGGFAPDHVERARIPNSSEKYIICFDIFIYIHIYKCLINLVLLPGNCRNGHEIPQDLPV